ncbi:hypothetical protein AVEN_109664-1 [Araneus ventricosus]|uniref:Uncharacterized protein n=1 Tax=Araneus ventricosus TaxID=182803 RepID=A0A4Y2FX31_ARAVE|nr:hypothetical protein AVEN_109664-1 [Araneus ventricosus]
MFLEQEASICGSSGGKREEQKISSRGRMYFLRKHLSKSSPANDDPPKEDEICRICLERERRLEGKARQPPGQQTRVETLREIFTLIKMSDSLRERAVEISEMKQES